MLAPTFAILFALMPMISGILKQSSECSETLGCITNPQKTLMLTWQPKSQHVLFTLRGYIGSGEVYVAVGLSHDERMGEDDVTECVHTGDSVWVYLSYNLGRSNTRYTDEEIVNQTGIYENGTIQCSFTRPVKGSDITGGQRRYDLDQPWHVLLVWGTLVPGTPNKRQHTYKSASSHKVSLKEVGSFETQKFNPPLVKLHGSLMLIAWVTLTSLGIIMARHYKGLLSQTQVFGKQIWFQVHRALMAAVVVLTISGVAVVIVELGGYSEIPDSSEIFLLLHPILGFIVTGLCILNPIMAVFRPASTAPRRPIFNWVHRCVGTGCQIIAVVTIFFGLKLRSVHAPFSMMLVLGAFVAWHVTVEGILLCIVFIRKHRSADDKRQDSYSVRDKQDTQAENNKRPSQQEAIVFQEILLMLHSAVAIATMIFLLAQLLHEHDEDS